MEGYAISRRAAVARISLGAVAAITGAVSLASEPAQASDLRNYSGTASPCSLQRGHSLAIQVYLPAVQRSDQLNSFRLALKTTDGKTLLTHDFQLAAGAATEIIVAVMADGSVRVNDVPVKGLVVDLLVVIAIIAILIGLLLPAVQKVQASLTSYVPGKTSSDRSIDYILPYIE